MALAMNHVVHPSPKRIKELQFGILSAQDIADQSVVEVFDRNVYDATTTGPHRTVTRNGPLDGRMGAPNRSTECETCGEYLSTCSGHFGQVRLALPAFHIGYFRKVIEVLQSICKCCSRVLLEPRRRQIFLTSLSRRNLDGLQRSQICKKISIECRKAKICPYCHYLNGTVRKVPNHSLKIVHDQWSSFTRSTAKNKIYPASKLAFDRSFENAIKNNPELEKHVRKAIDDLNPLRVLQLFKNIAGVDCKLLGMDPRSGRPEMFLWQSIPAPPICIRPSVAQDAATTEDDITIKLGDIIHTNSVIQTGLEKGRALLSIQEQWDQLQLQIGLYINSDAPGLQQHNAKPIKGFCQRLKGKQGRFRGNLSGKRVDFTSRTVIGPDPNLGINEVAIPEQIATQLTFPERVSRCNLEQMKACVRNGPANYPGAKYVIKHDTGRKIYLGVLARTKRLDSAADQIKIGDVVERHLMDRDIVLFNRQPSLHKLSILCHEVKVRPGRTFRLNECVCTPYNADFDGDEMNLHVPQTWEARAEAQELMGVQHNLVTPKNGTPIIAAIQDFITAAYSLSGKDNFFDRATFAQICGYMFDEKDFEDQSEGGPPIDLPPPTILKPQRLWTGKQVFNVLMRPNKRSCVLVNLDAACKQFKPTPGLAPDRNEDDSWLIVRNSEVMCGVMDKATVGDGKKDSIFYVILRDFGSADAVRAMNRLAKLSARWLSDRGFSIGINDVYPGDVLARRKQRLVDEAYARCDQIIRDFKEGRLSREPGCDEEQTLENRITGVLNRVREEAGNSCFQQLDKWNAALMMAKSGSKGSLINVSQMVAVVGQQIINSSRVADGFQDRTLPHFPKAARQPPSKGFVRNSFFTGLTPTEFIFHAMSGREGLVDTAVKTAETGYMSRRLMKSLEDLSANYDNTVRNSSSGIVQFQYGDDKLDPADMEAKAKPVNFERTFTLAVARTWNNEDPGLLPSEIRSTADARLTSERSRYQRYSLVGKQLDYHDASDAGIDQHESKRDFLDAIETFISIKAKEVGHARSHVQMPLDTQQCHTADGIVKFSAKALHEFLDLCLTKYAKSIVQPGHAVGAVGAQSIGEPGTQMTLKTFHFAGVAGMSITQGVPRIKEVINASKVISTPVITCELLNPESETAARMVKSHIEKTYVKDVISRIDDKWSPEGCQLVMQIDSNAVESLQLSLEARAVERALRRSRALKLTKFEEILYKGNQILLTLSDVEAPVKGRRTRRHEDSFSRVQYLKRVLPGVVIQGFPDANRAIIKRDDKPNVNGIEEMSLLVEGYGLKACLTTEGVDASRTRTNSILEVRDVLGVEAARTTIIEEIRSVMGQMDIDPRHMQLLADVMTYKGDVLGITRFGLAKMRDSVLQLASFERTPDHLFDAAFHMKTDKIEGVTECIIMGQPIKIGTGAFKVVRRLGVSKGDLRQARKEPAFNSAFADWKTS